MLYDFSNYWYGINGRGVPADGRGTIQNVLSDYSLSKFASHVPILTVGDWFSGSAATYPYDNSQLSVHPTNIVNMSDSLLLAIKYAITATPQAVKGTTYIVEFDICSDELVTVGDSPQKAPLPFSNSTVIY
jgi:hypothetical protein